MAGLIYLAGAIDAVDSTLATEWREKARKQLCDAGYATFSPPHAFFVPEDADQDTCERVIEVNGAAVLRSMAVLANLAGPSFGTPLEVQMAIDNGIPAFCFGGSMRSIYRYRTHSYVDMPTAIAKLLAELQEEE